MAYDFSGLKFLIVDDNQYMRSVFRELLRALGLKAESIQECVDGTDAISTLHSFSADLALIDLLMEPMDGLEFTRRVRRDSDSPNPFLPIIMCTGFTETERVQAARDAGVNEVLAKPITATTLYDRIRSIIEHPRPYTKMESYFGPDRRRQFASDFEPKRQEDHALEAVDAAPDAEAEADAAADGSAAEAR